jgi:hypothetical protein
LTSRQKPSQPTRQQLALAEESAARQFAARRPKVSGASQAASMLALEIRSRSIDIFAFAFRWGTASACRRPHDVVTMMPGTLPQFLLRGE